MKKAVILDAELLFDLKPGENSFNIILEKLGEKAESNWEMIGLREKVDRMRWVRKEKIEKAVDEFISERLNRDVRFVLNQIKGKGYKIFLVNSNPSIIYEFLKERLPIDEIFATKLVFDREACLGEYLKLDFDSIFLGNLKKKFGWVINFDGEPNRYGLALSLYKYMEDNEIDFEKSFVLANKLVKLPVAEFIGKLIVLGKAEKEIADLADFKIKEISEILNLV